MTADEIDHRFAVEMKVRFVDQHHRVRRAARDFDKLRARGHGARRAVGIGDGDDLGARRDGGEQALEGKLQIVRGLHSDRARIRCRRVDLIHRVGGNGQQQFVAGFEKGLEEHVNGFIHAIGESDLRRGEAKMRGDDGLHRLALGIARERAGGDAAQHLAHLGRAGQRVLVEVEAQRIAAAERRVILLHGPHAGARRSGCNAAVTRLQPRDLLLRKRVRMASAWPVRPSASASNAACGPSARNCLRRSTPAR